MSTKKKAADPQIKLLVTAMKKTINTNTVLPILEDVLFFPDRAIVYDLETHVTVPFILKGIPESGVCVPGKMLENILAMADTLSAKVDKSHGVTFVDGERTMKLMGDDPMNYPKSPAGPWEPIGTFGPEQVQDVAMALLFVSNDDLRPAMTGIYFKDDIAATDAHRLFWKKIEPMKKDFIMRAKAARIMLALGGNKWELSANEGKEVVHVRLINEHGVEIITRAIDARFPDYNQVLPNIKEVVGKMTACPSMFLKEITYASKFANRSTMQVTFSMTDVVKISSQDVDFSNEYHNKVKGAEVKYIGENKSIDIAFNAKLLTQIINLLPSGEPIEMDLWAPTKAAIINKHFLLMPLMLG